MPYFKALNLLYLHIPKTGGMSIEDYLYKKCNIERYETNLYGYYYNKEKRIRVENERTLQHFTYNEIQNIKKNMMINMVDIQNIENSKILVSIRNPFERIVSDIFWNKKLGANEKTTADDFYDILLKYLSDTDYFIDNHKTPQYKFILNGSHFMKNIMVVKTESLKRDMISFGYTDFDIHINKNEKTVNYRELLNEKSVELIIQYYALDFMYFGYSTNIYDTISYPISTPLNIYNGTHLVKQSVPLEFQEKQLPINEIYRSKATIVTAFIKDINKNRKIEDYIEYGKKLLSVPVPKIVFIDTESYKLYFSHMKNEHTHFIIFNLSDMYLQDYKHLITDFNLETYDNDKDTMEYIFVQCYKTEWVRRAIELDIYNTEQYIWVDFGIFHMIKSDSVFKNGIFSMCQKEYSRLRISCCKFREYICPYNVYKRLTWNFAGSVFGGDKKSLITFANIVKFKILETIQTKKTIMWELCFWYLIKDVVPDLYDCYICGHDFRILELY